MHDLSGRVAIVTGAAGGIGEAQARLLAEHGASVVLADMSPAGNEVANAIGERALYVEHDVTDLASWARLVASTEGRFGSLDILVNSAGISQTGTIEEMTPEIFTRIWQVNTLGVFLGIKAVVGPMKREGRGAIVNTVSAAALTANVETHAYSSSKWAARGLTRTAAKELAPFGIRVNAIHPGPVDTPLLRRGGVDPDLIAAVVTAAGFAARPEDIAQATLFLVSDEARYAYGTELCIDGGQSL